ncbi:MAG: hypothetical protein J0L77_06550 [Alphaproteobacteria bacterium]|nr:hypothetical protein [Alphaproteobacteria bacterium]
MSFFELLEKKVALFPSFTQILSQSEIWFKSHEHSISAIGAFGTWAAVVVAIWLANKTSKPRLQVYVDKRIDIPSEAQVGGTVNWDLCQDVVGVNLTNKGQVRVFISYWSFHWGFPWCSFGAMQNPSYPDFRAKEIALEPGQSAAITLINDIDKHKENIKEFCRLSKIPFYLRRFITLKVYASDGTVFIGKYGKSYKKEFF